MTDVVSESVALAPWVTRNDFVRVEAQKYPTASWISPEHLNYESMVAEQFRIGCIAVKIEGVPAHSCKVIGQYEDMISILYANIFEDQWFTWQDMERVLRAIDDGMAAEMQ